MRAFWAAVILCGLCAQPALAAPGPSSGVHIDSGSPAAKEYRIPIAGARSEAAGDGSGSPQSANPPTFGIGVTTNKSPAPTTTALHHSGHGVHRGDTARGQVDRRRSRHRRNTVSGANKTGPGAHKTGPDAGKTSSGAGRSAPGAGNTTDQTRAAARTEADAGSISWLPLAAGGALVLLVGCGAGLVFRRLV